MSVTTVNAEIKGIKTNLSNAKLLTSLQFAANYQGRFTPVPMGSTITFSGDSFTDENGGGGASFNRIFGIMTVVGPYLHCLPGYNQGVGGDTINDLQARNATTIANIADVMSMQVATNGISQNIPAATWIQAYKEEVNSYFDNGAKKVVAHFPPMKSDSATTPWDESQKSLYAAYLAEFEKLSDGYDGNLIVDTYSRTVIDPDLDTTDGTHLNQTGAIKYGKAQGEFIMLAVESLRPYANLVSDNLLTNPGLSGTGGSTGGICTGAVADDWTVGSNGSGVTAVCSKTLNVFGDGREAQTVTLAGTSDASAKVLNLRQDITLTGGVTGDVYVCYCRFKIEGGHSGVTSFYAQVNGTGFKGEENSNTYNEFHDGAEIVGCMTTVPGAALASDAPAVQVQFNIRIATGNVNAVIHFDSPILRKIV